MEQYGSERKVSKSSDSAEIALSKAMVWSEVWNKKKIKEKILKKVKEFEDKKESIPSSS